MIRGNSARTNPRRAMASMWISSLVSVTRASLQLVSLPILSSRAVAGLSGSARPAVGQRLTRRPAINHGLQNDLDNRSVAA